MEQGCSTACVCIRVLLHHRTDPKKKNLFQSNELQELQARRGNIHTHRCESKDLGPKLFTDSKEREWGAGGGGRLGDTLGKNLTHTSPVNGSPVERGNEVAPIKRRGRSDRILEGQRA